MRKKWLILDCNYLCHRAKHTTGGLSYENKPTGVIYGFLKTIISFQEMFDTPYIVFCWDSRTSKREDIYPAYKQQRKSRYSDLTDKEIQFEKEFRYQMKKLRRKYLFRIGFKNVFVQPGYESDDIIGSICINLPMVDEAVIISSDKDMYQLIRHNVVCYNPQKNKILTLQGFKKQYGIIPEQWIAVKCIAGCNTDEVVGIRGVGEKTVIKYLQGELKETTKAFQKIEKEKVKYTKKNYPLVALPFKGTMNPILEKDKILKDGWRAVTKELGMKSIRNRIPKKRSLLK